MNDAIIENINKKVSQDSYLINLGDFAFSSDALEFSKRIKCYQIFVLGNHDKQIPNGCFEQVYNYLEVSVDKIDIMLFHYPMEEWNKSLYKSYHLHGHCHGNLATDNTKLRLDVGIDNHPNLEPFSFKEVKDIMAKKMFAPHHQKETK